MTVVNRASSHEQSERRRAVKKKQKAARRARVIRRMSELEKQHERERHEIDIRLRGLAQFAGCRAADEYAAVLQAKKELL